MLLKSSTLKQLFIFSLNIYLLKAGSIVVQNLISTLYLLKVPKK